MSKLSITEALCNWITESGGTVTEDERTDVASAIDTLSGVAGGGGSLDVMTTTEFSEYLESKGWHKGTYTVTIDGQEYTAGKETSFGVPAYPQRVFSTSGECHIVVPDGETPFYINGNVSIVDGSATSENVLSIAKTKNGGFLILRLYKVAVAGMLFHVAQDYSTKIEMFSSVQDGNTIHDKYDVGTIARIRNYSLTIQRGKAVIPSYNVNPKITLGSTELDEAKLQALLGLLNS